MPQAKARKGNRSKLQAMGAQVTRAEIGATRMQRVPGAMPGRLDPYLTRTDCLRFCVLASSFSVPRGTKDAHVFKETFQTFQNY